MWNEEEEEKEREERREGEEEKKSQKGKGILKNVLETVSPLDQNIHMLLGSPDWECLNVSFWSIFISQTRDPMMDS